MKSKIIFSFIFFLLISLIPLATVNATTGICTRGSGYDIETSGTCDTSSPSSCPSGYDCVANTSPNTSDTVTLTNPIGTTDLPTLLGKVINSIMGIIGSLALVMFIYGGAIWMLSAGNQEQVTKGKNILIWAAVGIVIIFSAYALVKLVFTSLGA
ncbi:MAG: hypothetical protein WC349_05045 [Patescibacteria group bacterium]|jgi:hypothetical protein